MSYAALNVEQVYSKMESAGDKTNIIILDACRNNPFPGAERSLERGLAVVGNVQPPQSLIVYATAPGKTAQDGEGRNGVFTSAFLKHLADPSLDAELMLRRVREDVIAATSGNQIPWQNSSITGAGFAFAGGGTLAVSTDPAGADVYVDGQKRGVSPLLLSDLPRYSEIEIEARSGSRSAVQKIVLKDAVGQKLDLKLEIGRGSILITANEKVAKAFLDGAEVTLGTTGQIEGVEVGVHTLELQGDSSAFTGQVEVIQGSVAPVKVTLVPQGFLTLTLPANVVCRVEGPGVDKTTSEWNFGQIPAGSYRLTVSGGDYETDVESISVSRAQKYEFAPKLKFTVAYLQAKYGADLDRLQKLADANLASQSDVSEASVLPKRIRAEERPELAALASRAEALAARYSAAAAAPAASTATTGTLSLISDPAGMKVSIDHGEPVETPASVELSPGSHSVRPLESYMDNTYYVEQPEQSVLVAAGEKISTLVKAQAAKATLAIRGVPDGYDVFINDEKVGVTPLGELTVRAGELNIRFERSGESPRGMMIIARPNGTPTAFWGSSKLPAQLQRRTIALDGKTDGWEGIVPLVDLSGSSSTFMGETGISIARVYMCRNDKDLFWRVDFNETNPLLNRPKGTDKGITCLLSFLYKPSEQLKQLQLGEVYWKPSNSLHNYIRFYDGTPDTADLYLGAQVSFDRKETTGKYPQVLKNVDIRSYGKMLVGRAGLDEIADICKGAVGVQVQLHNLNHIQIWAESQSTDIRYIDFSK